MSLQYSLLFLDFYINYIVCYTKPSIHKKDMQGPRKVDDWGEGHIQIFVFGVINFFSNPLFSRHVKRNI